jgi:Uma2 family endonuclease
VDGRGVHRDDQEVFGDAWRYELVDGRIVAHAAPAPDHGVIVSAIAIALGPRLPARCRPESGSAATPRAEQRNTARIPDLIVRCGEHPTVAFEVVSPSEIRGWRARDLKCQHLQAVEGLEEIVEIYQGEAAAHVYRLMPGGSWSFEAVGGEEAALRIESLGIELPMAEIYAYVRLPRPEEPSEEAPAS